MSTGYYQNRSAQSLPRRFCEKRWVKSIEKASRPFGGWEAWAEQTMPRYGAGEGNRTPVFSLGSWHSTIELHPHVFFIIADPAGKCKPFSLDILYKMFCFFHKKLFTSWGNIAIIHNKKSKEVMTNEGPLSECARWYRRVDLRRRDYRSQRPLSTT